MKFLLFTISLQTLCNDVLAVLKKMYGDSPPAIVLVGHRFCPSDSLVSISYILTLLIVSIVWFFLGEKCVFIHTLENKKHKICIQACKILNTFT